MFMIVLSTYSCQLSAKDKTGLGYEDQLSESDSEVLPSVFDIHSTDGDDNPTNDRFKKGNGYHAVPPPLTGNYMPPLADLSFAGLDDSIYRPTSNKVSASISKGEPSVIKISNISVKMPKVDSIRTSGVIIEDWVIDDEDTLVDTQVDSQTTVKPSFKKIKFTKARNESVKCDKQADTPKIVTQNSKADRKDWNCNLTQKPRISKETVNTVRINGVNTAGQTSVSIVEGNGVTAVKTSVGCVWRTKITNLNHVFKDSIGSWISKRVKLIDPQGRLKEKTHHEMSLAALWHLPSFVLLPFRNSISQEGSGEDSLKLKELMDLCTNLSNKVLDLESEVIDINSTNQEKIEKLESKESSKQRRKLAVIDADVEINLKKVQAEAYNLDLDHQEKVLSMLDVNDEELTGVEEVLEVVKAVKLITEVVTTVGVNVNDATVKDTPITVAEATKVIVEVSKPRKRKDEEVARQLEAELNADINWNAVIEQVKRSERLTDCSNEISSSKEKAFNRSSIQEEYDSPQAFLNKVNEGIKVPEKEVRQEKEGEVESSKREDESLEQEIVKKQKMEQEIEELKKRLQIVPDDDDDDVYPDATPLASKILIVDYKINTERNKPYFKIIRADGNHRLFMSFSTMMKNFDSDDLESLWKIARERFEKTEPKNYTDDYLLNTLKIMFEKPNVEANIFLLVEKMYPLTHFTLEQMVNDVRLEVDYKSKMSLELLRLVRR
uniref:Uncharacterized protein n=1 Tax=Tanacetum cinerariifolium TaxID=118510 RepID=A0A6L2LLN8_TANCI|nr:hypothetical protein [Tanacetum cinerariifolium]